VLVYTAGRCSPRHVFHIRYSRRNIGRTSRSTRCPYPRRCTVGRSRRGSQRLTETATTTITITTITTATSQDRVVQTATSTATAVREAITGDRRKSIGRLQQIMLPKGNRIKCTAMIIDLEVHILYNLYKYLYNNVEM